MALTELNRCVYIVVRLSIGSCWPSHVDAFLQLLDFATLDVAVEEQLSVVSQVLQVWTHDRYLLAVCLAVAIFLYHLPFTHRLRSLAANLTTNETGLWIYWHSQILLQRMLSLGLFSLVFLQPSLSFDQLFKVLNEVLELMRSDKALNHVARVQKAYRLDILLDCLLVFLLLKEFVSMLLRNLFLNLSWKLCQFCHVFCCSVKLLFDQLVDLFIGVHLAEADDFFRPLNCLGFILH